MRKKSWGIILFLILANIILFTVLSCEKDPTDIGLDIQPGSDRMDLFMDSIPVNTFTISEDRIASDERSLSPLGSYTDPVFGLVKAEFATQFRLSSSNADFSSQVENADSLYLYLYYKDYYGDTTVAQQIKIHEISTSLYTDSSYYSDRIFEDADLSLLADAEFKPVLTDSVIAIKMPTSLVNRIIAEENSGAFLDNDSFYDFFKGIYVSVEDQPGDGSIAYLNLLSSESRMTLYYNDSLTFDFVINSSCARYNLFSHDYSAASTELTSVLDDSITPNEWSFTQCMSGPKIKVEIPDLAIWNDSADIAINMAQLSMTVIQDDRFAPPPRMALVAVNGDGLNEFLTDYKINSTYFGGSLNETEHTYTFNIPIYIQEMLIDTTLQGNGLFIYPYDNRVNAARAKICGGAHSASPMQIRIMYSKF